MMWNGNMIHRSLFSLTLLFLTIGVGIWSAGAFPAPRGGQGLTPLGAEPLPPTVTFAGKVYRQDVSGAPASHSEGEILGNVTVSSDPRLLGRDITSDLAAGCPARILVEGTPFLFENFVSYEEGKDEPAAAYLLLYGAESAEDITELAITNGEETMTIGDRDTIGQFYEKFKELKDPAAAYLELMEEGGTERTASADRQELVRPPETGLLAGGCVVNIRFGTGFEREFAYYPKSALLQRWRVEGALRDFLDSCCV